VHHPLLDFSNETVQADLEKHGIRQQSAECSASLGARRLPASGLHGLSFRAARIFHGKVQQPLADSQVIDLPRQLFAAFSLIFEIRRLVRQLCRIPSLAHDAGTSPIAHS
jgi:hypothetical protein